MAGYIGAPRHLTQTLTNLISNGSLASNTTGWTINSKNTVTQYDGYISLQVKTTDSSNINNYQAFSSTISGSTAATKQIIYYQQEVCGKPSSTNPPGGLIRGNKNGSSTSSYYYTENVTTPSTITCNFSSINMSTLPSGGYAYATINSGTTHYTTGSVTLQYGDVVHIYLDRTSNNGNAGVYLYHDKSSPDEMPDYHEWSNSLTYDWDTSAAPNNFTNATIVFENDDSGGYLNCTIKIDMAWYKKSEYLETFDGTDYYSYNRALFSIIPSSVVDDVGFFRNLFVVNLTTEFGAGNEPTKTWCDENLYMEDGVVKYQTTTTPKALLLKNIYFGVGGVAKKVKRAYIGINGIAKLWYDGLIKLYALLNWGTTSDTLSTSKYGMAAGSVGDYAIFAGGSTNMLNLANSTISFSKTVDAYNSSLVHSSLSDLSSNITYPGVVTLGDQMIIAGGMSAASNGGIFGAQRTTTTVLSTTKYYNSSAVLSTGQSLSTGRVGLAGDIIGNYALFAGGNLATSGSTSASFSSVVEAFTSASVKTTSPSSLQTGVSKVASCHGDDYVIFAGGISSGVDPQGYISSTSSITGINYVTAYNTSLVKTNAPNLTYSECYPSAARAGNYLLVTERDTSSNAISSKVNVYNGSTLSKLTALTLSENKNNTMATTINNCAYFLGGWLTQQGHYSGDFSSKVEGFTPDLVRFSITDLSTAKMEGGIATAGSYTLFAGGKTSGSSMIGFVNSVDVYKNVETPALYIGSGGSTDSGSNRYGAYLKVNSTNYTSVGEVSINTGDSLTIYAKSGSRTYYDSDNNETEYTVLVRVRVNGTVVMNGSYSDYSSYSLGTVPRNTAYSVKLKAGSVTSSNYGTTYVDIYTTTGLQA